MERYDRGYGRSAGGWRGAARYGAQYEGDYGDDFAGTGRERMMRRMQRMRSGAYDRGLFGSQAAAYDRGVYGSVYPTFGGSPRDSQQGMYYGGGLQHGAWRGERGRGGAGYAPGGYGSGYARGGAGGGGAQAFHGGTMGRGVYDRAGGFGGGYDRFARQPFLPEAAYRRHPELNRPPMHPGVGWPSHQHASVREPSRSDAEIEEEVRANLYQDSWVDADRIEVEVEDAVVTLRGEVDDFLEARYAWDDAWEATGVHGVINQITVRTDRAPTPHHDLFPQAEAGEE